MTKMLYMYLVLDPRNMLICSDIMTYEVEIKTFSAAMFYIKTHSLDVMPHNKI